jgi:hypothetical protein
LFLESRQLLLSPVSADVIQMTACNASTRSPAVFDKLTALKIVEKLFIFGIQQTPGNEQIKLAAVECAFNCGRIFNGGGFGMTAVAEEETLCTGCLLVMRFSPGC